MIGPNVSEKFGLADFAGRIQIIKLSLTESLQNKALVVFVANDIDLNFLPNQRFNRVYKIQHSPSTFNQLCPGRPKPLISLA
jgi:hypothetical protein